MPVDDRIEIHLPLQEMFLDRYTLSSTGSESMVSFSEFHDAIGLVFGNLPGDELPLLAPGQSGSEFSGDETFRMGVR